MSDAPSGPKHPPATNVVVRQRRRAEPSSAPTPLEVEAPAGRAEAPDPPAAPNPDYEVGYGRPPRKHRFGKNESGNPKGRPKGAKGFKPALRKAVATRMQVKVNGRTVRLSQQEAICLTLVNKAARGDLRAVKLLLDLDPTAHEELARGMTSAVDATLDAEDEATLASYLRSVVSALKDDPEEGK